VTLEQATRYPWNGTIRLTVMPQLPVHFALHLRIPEWAEKREKEQGVIIRINDEVMDLRDNMVDGYARLTRLWQAGDVIDLLLPLDVRPQYANPKIRQDVGRVAIMRGPLVYCAEEVDNGADLNMFIVPENMNGVKLTSLDNLGEAVILDIGVEKEGSADWGLSLYRDRRACRKKTRLRLVPYHLWDNRANGAMLVWFQAG